MFRKKVWRDSAMPSKTTELDPAKLFYETSSSPKTTRVKLLETTSVDPAKIRDLSHLPSPMIVSKHETRNANPVDLTFRVTRFAFCVTLLVGEEGLEPSRSCPRTALNRMCLPIPPLALSCETQNA